MGNGQVWSDERWEKTSWGVAFTMTLLSNAPAAPVPAKAPPVETAKVPVCAAGGLGCKGAIAERVWTDTIFQASPGAPIEKTIVRKPLCDRCYLAAEGWMGRGPKTNILRDSARPELLPRARMAHIAGGDWDLLPEAGR